MKQEGKIKPFTTQMPCTLFVRHSWLGKCKTSSSQPGKHQKNIAICPIPNSSFASFAILPHVATWRGQHFTSRIVLPSARARAACFAVMKFSRAAAAETRTGFGLCDCYSGSGERSGKTSLFIHWSSIDFTQASSVQGEVASFERSAGALKHKKGRGRWNVEK